MKTYRAKDIARYFLSLVDPDDNDVSNLKLQKLCYYAQGISSAIRGEPLFRDKLEAWEHGPVVPNLYHEYKKYGSSSIDPVSDFDDNTIDDVDREVLTDVYEYYAQFSPWRLRCMTHDETPWVDARKSASKEISPVQLMNHFKPMLNGSYVKDKKRKIAA